MSLKFNQLFVNYIKILSLNGHDSLDEALVAQEAAYKKLLEEKEAESRKLLDDKEAESRKLLDEKELKHQQQLIITKDLKDLEHQNWIEQHQICYVYYMTNPSIPDVCKYGFSIDPQRRARDLQSDPNYKQDQPWSVQYQLQVLGGPEVEKIIQFFEGDSYLQLELYKDKGYDYAVDLIRRAQEEYMKPQFKEQYQSIKRGVSVQRGGSVKRSGSQGCSRSVSINNGVSPSVVKSVSNRNPNQSVAKSISTSVAKSITTKETSHPDNLKPVIHYGNNKRGFSDVYTFSDLFFDNNNLYKLINDVYYKITKTEHKDTKTFCFETDDVNGQKRKLQFFQLQQMYKAIDKLSDKAYQVKKYREVVFTDIVLFYDNCLYEFKNDQYYAITKQLNNVYEVQICDRRKVSLTEQNLQREYVALKDVENKIKIDKYETYCLNNYYFADDKLWVKETGYDMTDKYYQCVLTASNKYNVFDSEGNHTKMSILKLRAITGTE